MEGSFGVVARDSEPTNSLAAETIKVFERDMQYPPIVKLPWTTRNFRYDP